MSEPWPSLSLLALAVMAWLWAWRRRPGARVALGAVALALALGELAARALDLGNPGRPQWVEPLRGGSTSESPYLPGGVLEYRYPSDPRGVFGPQRRILGHVNALGLRGRECTLAKPPGTRRIALVGDSFTLGIGVRDEDTLPAQLERQLGRERFEVLNFGVSGAQTGDELATLRDFVLGFEPDVVVWVYFPNDVARTGTVGSLSRPRALAALRGVSWLANACVGALEAPRLRAALVREYLEDHREDAPAWLAAQRDLAQAARLLAERRVEFVVAVYPVLLGTDRAAPPLAPVHATVLRACRGLGIACVDLAPAFQGFDARQLWVHPADQHPNERAHLLAARRLADALIGVLGAVPGATNGRGER